MNALRLAMHNSEAFWIAMLILAVVGLASLIAGLRGGTEGE